VNRRIALILLGLIFIIISFSPNSSARRIKNISSDSLTEVSVGKEAALDLWMNYIKVGNHIFWSAIPLYVQEEIMEKMAVELGKDVDSLAASDFSRRFDFLGGRTLNKLYEYYMKIRRTAIQDFEQLLPHLKEIVANMRSEIQQLTPIELMRKVLDNLPEEKELPVSYADVVIDYISRGGRVDWANVPLAAQKNLLEKAAEELGKSWKDLSFNDFFTKLECFNGYRLARIFQYYSGIKKGAENHPQAMPKQIKDRIDSLSSDKIKAMTTIDFIKFVLDSGVSTVELIITAGQKNQQLYASVESIISLMRGGENIFWAEVPLYMQAQLLQKCCEESGVEFDQIGAKFFSQHFDLLNGRTLKGLLQYWSGQFTKDYTKLPELPRSLITKAELRTIKNRVDFIRHILGIYLTGNNPICQNIQELIDLIEEKNGDINWSRVPLPLQKELLNEVTVDLGYKITALDEDILRDKSIGLLWGNTLESFYDYYDSLLKKARRNYDSLSKFYKFFVTREEIANLATLGFIGKLLGINFENSELTANDNNDPVLDSFNDNIYSAQEKKWIKGYSEIKDYYWEEIAQKHPQQIAFYVRELAVYVAKTRGDDFKDLWDLLQERNFREIKIPCLDHTLLSLLHFFGDKYSILIFLENNNLLDEITQGVKERLN